MDPALLGIVVDSSVLIAAERRKLATPDVIRIIREIFGDVPIVICALTVAELGHGIYRADTPERSHRRRQFLDELKAHIPIYPVSDATAEIIARIGGEQAAKGVTIPLADSIIGACAIELGYAIATENLRDFSRIPGLELKKL
jgi:predicted nucleic acid-binding protein